MANRKSYKNYFRKGNDEETPVSIPKSTRYRVVKPRRLIQQFLEQEDMDFSDNDMDNVARTSSPTIDPSISPNEMDKDSDSDFSSDISEDLLQHTDSTSPLFVNGKITSQESLLLIYGFLLRHKLSKCATSDLLNLLNFHLPIGVSIPPSVFLLEKALAPDYTTVTKNFYCPKCEKIVAQPDECSTCKLQLNRADLLQSGKFFITFDFSIPLKSILDNPILQKSVMNNLKLREVPGTDSNIKDIMDGFLYKSLPFGKYDLSCCINTDGVSIFESSKFSIWPILISVNELDYSLRRKNTILAGLWFGCNKPNFDAFLSPFIDACNDLTDIGISWNYEGIKVNSKIYFPMVAADSVARCSLQGIKQFNGNYGCPWCLIKGETFTSETGKRKWIYPPTNALCRTKAGFINHVKTLATNLRGESNDNCFGILAASQFLKLKHFDIVSGFVFDYMHTVLLGVVRSITSMWLDSSNHSTNFYIGNREAEISLKYENCKVPFESSRVTRSLSDFKYWKASEWKNWMLVCVPLLQDYLRSPYLDHFAKLVYAISLLNSSSVSMNDLIQAQDLLREFCFTAPNLYGKSICSFNMHLLLHAVDAVRQWGPLWAYSLFQFEHFNGILTSYFNGPSQVCMQIIRKVIITQHINAVDKNKFNNQVAKQYFSSLLERKKFNLKFYRLNGVVFLGAKRVYTFNEREIRKLSKIEINGVEGGLSYKSCIFGGRKLNVINSDSKKRVNSIVNINDKLHVLHKIIVINTPDPKAIVLVKRIISVPVTNLHNVTKVTEISSSVKIFNLSSVKISKVLCGYNVEKRLIFIAGLPNTIELE